MSISITAGSISPACKRQFTLIVYGGSGLYLGSFDAARRCTYIYKCQENDDPVYVQKVSKALVSICYDPQRNCYWAAEACSSSVVYRLDQAFQIVGTVRLNVPCGCHDAIKSIGIRCECSEIIIAYTWYIYRFSLQGAYLASEEAPCTNMDYVSCAPVSPYIGKIFYRQGQYFFVLCLHEEMICEEKLPDDVTPLSLAYCYEDDGVALEFYILGRNNSMLKIGVPRSCLGDGPYDCNFNCAEPKPPTDCVGIIESIAAVENSIAALLHAEAEKLQKIIHESDDVDELLAANGSVLKVLRQVTMIEQLLVMKLAACATDCEEIDRRVGQLCKQCSGMTIVD